mgnify:CR=1 FL=1
MKKNKLILLIILNFFGYELIAKDSSIFELEKRVELLEKQVSKLEKKSKNQVMETKWRKLKKGLTFAKFIMDVIC